MERNAGHAGGVIPTPGLESSQPVFRCGILGGMYGRHRVELSRHPTALNLK